MSRNTAIYQRALGALPGGNTRTTLHVEPHAPYASHGDGAVVTDVDGHRLIDCNNNYTSLIHGHRHEPSLRAAQDWFARGTAFGLPTETEVLLAQELSRRLPSMHRWRFVNSGTESVMQAIRIARAFTGRDIIVRFVGSYHGTADDAVDPSSPGVAHRTRQSVISLPAGDAIAFQNCLQQNTGRVAAVLLDLMPNRAGLIPADAEFVRMVRKATSGVGALLIIDEVITFRLGLSGLQGKYGVTPDITTLGKIIGGGFPVGAVGGSAEVMEQTNPRNADAVVWGGTFSANPISMAAGLASLQAYETETIEALNTWGNELRADFKAWGIRCSGEGSLIRIFPDDNTQAWWQAYKHGLLLGTNGLLALSTAMSSETIEEIREMIPQVVSAAQSTPSKHS